MLPLIILENIAKYLDDVQIWYIIDLMKTYHISYRNILLQNLRRITQDQYIQMSDADKSQIRFYQCQRLFSIERGTLPNSLVKLDIVDCILNTPIEIGVLPITLKYLFFGIAYNQPIKKGVIHPFRQGHTPCLCVHLDPGGVHHALQTRCDLRRTECLTPRCSLPRIAKGEEPLPLKAPTWVAFSTKAGNLLMPYHSFRPRKGGIEAL